MRRLLTLLCLLAACSKDQGVPVYVTVPAVPAGVQAIFVGGTLDGKPAMAPVQFTRDLSSFRVLLQPDTVRGDLVLLVFGLDHPLAEGGCAVAWGTNQAAPLAIGGPGPFHVTIPLEALGQRNCAPFASQDMAGTADLGAPDGGAPDLPAPDLATPTWRTGQAAVTLGGSFNQPADVCFSGGLVYVSDAGLNQVRVYRVTDLGDAPHVKSAAPAFTIGPVAVGLALAGPRGLWCGCEDAGCATHSLLVADTLNHRVTYYQGYGDAPADHPQPDGIIGQAGATKNAPNRGMAATVPNGLSSPSGVFWDGPRLDSLPRRVYIADTGNNRVVGYVATSGDAVKALGAGTPDVAFGQKDLSSGGAPGSPAAAVLSGPLAVAVAGDRVAIADANFHRVPVYDVPAASPALPLRADAVLGQGDLMTGLNGSGPTRLYGPAAVLVRSGWTFVADKFNDRVLVYGHELPGAGTYGPGAFAALGQPALDMIKMPPDVGAADLDQPAGVALAVIAGQTVLFVADQGNHRVQVFYKPM